MPHLDIETARRFLRNELPGDERAQWTAHLAECAVCRDLLAHERAFASMVQLGETPVADTLAPQHAPRGLERTLAAAEAAAGTPARGWSLGLALFVLAGLLGLIGWQLHAAPDPRATQAAALRISPELQQRVVAQLEALEALRLDPWLATDYQAVQTLEEYLREEGWP